MNAHPDHRTTEPQTPAQAARWKRRFFILLALVLLPTGAVVTYLAARFLPDEPVVYADPLEHFKYGSTGGERESGFPYWIWQVLPTVCAKYLPGQGYASLGMIFEPGKDLPIGVSKRRNMGIDRVFLNCAACHTSTVRTRPDAPPQIYTGMPAHRLDLMAFERFFFNCAADPKFSTEFIVPEIDRAAGKRSLIDRYLVYPVAIALMRERLLMLRGRFSFVDKQAPWGPGRVDTFNSAKVLFNFPMDRLPARELVGPSDFPSIWNQRAKRGMQLHWDGNNSMTEERNKNAAFGTGTTPPTIDLAAIGRIESLLLDAKPPQYPLPIDAALAARGAPIYAEYCAACHGTNGQDFGFPAKEPECVKPGEDDAKLYGPQVGKITRIADIGTDRGRLDSFSPELAVNLSTLYAGYPYRYCHFRKTWGYANLPLDGLWLRAPYLHNGSVPTLRDLLEPSGSRPKTFYRGDDLLDGKRLGFVSDVAEENGQRYFLYDTTLPGNGNRGHEGKAYGTELAPDAKDALVEYLKTF